MASGSSAVTETETTHVRVFGRHAPRFAWPQSITAAAVPQPTASVDETFLFPTETLPNTAQSENTAVAISRNAALHRGMFGPMNVNVASQHIYCRHRLYVGKLLQMPPPEELGKKWDEDILPRLANDLDAITEKLPKKLSRNETIIDPDLCMAGYAARGSDNVDMWPTVWLRCGGKKCRKEVRSAVRVLKYVQDFAARRIEIRCRAPYPAAFIPVECNERSGSMVVSDSMVQFHSQAIEKLHGMWNKILGHSAQRFWHSQSKSLCHRRYNRGQRTY